MAEYLVQYMAALGFRARRDGVGNVVGTLGDAGAERAIVLLGYMDTVSGLVPVRREGGRLYGRGAVDAKVVKSRRDALQQVRKLEGPVRSKSH